MQLSRGLASSNRTTVRQAIASLPEFSEASYVDDESIHITNHAKLDSLAASIVREAASAPYDLRDPRLPKPSKQQQDERHQAHEHWEKLWVPFGKRVALSAIATTSMPGPSSDDESTTNASDPEDALDDHDNHSSDNEAAASDDELLSSSIATEPPPPPPPIAVASRIPVGPHSALTTTPLSFC